MAQMIRTTVIGLLNKDIRLEDLQRFIEEKMAESAFSGFKTIQGFSNTEDGEPRRYVKFSKLFEIDPLDHRWNLNPFHEFARAGYGEVAWKFTKVENDGPEGENTTVSIQPELFDVCLDDDAGLPPNTFPESPGSEAFWRWFDDLEKH
jgi:hypothetical protein